MALSRADWLERRYGAEIRWVPFDLHPEYPPEGVPRTQVEARYGADLPEVVRSMIEDAGFRYNPGRQVPNSTRPLEVAELARDRGVFEPVHRGLFTAYWSEGRNIGETDVLLEIAARGGLDEADVLRAIEELPHSDRVRTATRQALELGIAAVPAWIVDEKLYISGAAPLATFDRAMAHLGHTPVDGAAEPGEAADAGD